MAGHILEKGKIPALDGLRAVAFLALYGLHLDYLQMGWMGVQLFFVLSGYLITGILLKMKAQIPAREYFIKFYGRRFLRIFPLYYSFLFFILIFSVWAVNHGYKAGVFRSVIDHLPYAFTYLYNFFSSYSGFSPSRLLNHLWSLSVEEQFYIIWPFLLLLTPEQHMKKLFLGGIIAGPFFRLLLFLLHKSGTASYLIDPAPLAIYPLPFSHVDAFACGAYISRYAIPKARKWLVPFGIAIPVIGFASQMASTGHAGPISALGYPVTLPNAYQFIWAYSLLNLWFALLIYCIVHEHVLSGFLNWAPLQYLGKISYGLYVYHFPIIWFSGRIRDLGIPEPQAGLLITPISFIVTVIIASLSYALIEKPILNLKDRFFGYEMRPSQ